MSENEKTSQTNEIVEKVTVVSDDLANEEKVAAAATDRKESDLGSEISENNSRPSAKNENNKKRPVKKKKDPSFIPRGYFFEHDDREDDVVESAAVEKENEMKEVDSLCDKFEPLVLENDDATAKTNENNDAAADESVVAEKDQTKSSQNEKIDEEDSLKVTKTTNANNSSNNRDKNSRKPTSFGNNNNSNSSNGRARRKTRLSKNNTQNNEIEADSPWTHDRFDINEQQPKSKQEILKAYGYDIREGKKNDPPSVNSVGQQQMTDKNASNNNKNDSKTRLEKPKFNSHNNNNNKLSRPSYPQRTNHGVNGNYSNNNNNRAKNRDDYRQAEDRFGSRNLDKTQDYNDNNNDDEATDSKRAMKPRGKFNKQPSTINKSASQQTNQEQPHIKSYADSRYNGNGNNGNPKSYSSQNRNRQVASSAQVAKNSNEEVTNQKSYALTDPKVSDELPAPTNLVNNNIMNINNEVPKRYSSMRNQQQQQHHYFNVNPKQQINNNNVHYQQQTAETQFIYANTNGYGNENYQQQQNPSWSVNSNRNNNNTNNNNNLPSKYVKNHHHHQQQQPIQVHPHHINLSNNTLVHNIQNPHHHISQQQFYFIQPNEYGAVVAAAAAVQPEYVMANHQTIYYQPQSTEPQYQQQLSPSMSGNNINNHNTNFVRQSKAIPIINPQSFIN